MTYDATHTSRHDTEDKAWWLSRGEELEVDFINQFGGSLDAPVRLNPKKREDPTLPDLLYDGNLADLKVQTTPFFTASRYGLDPNFCVTFNRKDWSRYNDHYPGLVVIFWVDWKQLSYGKLRVQPFSGIFKLSMDEINQMVIRGAPEHAYQRRQNDQIGNAKSSFLFDVREMNKLV